MKEAIVRGIGLLVIVGVVAVAVAAVLYELRHFA